MSDHVDDAVERAAEVAEKRIVRKFFPELFEVEQRAGESARRSLHGGDLVPDLVSGELFVEVVALCGVDPALQFARLPQPIRDKRLVAHRADVALGQLLRDIDLLLIRDEAARRREVHDAGESV